MFKCYDRMCWRSDLVINRINLHPFQLLEQVFLFSHGYRQPAPVCQHNIPAIAFYVFLYEADIDKMAFVNSQKSVFMENFLKFHQRFGNNELLFICKVDVGIIPVAFTADNVRYIKHSNTFCRIDNDLSLRSILIGKIAEQIICL